MTTFNLKDETILRRLEKRFNVEEVKYNIITENFVYYNKHGEKKRISMESLLNHMEFEGLKEDRLYIILKPVFASYFPRRIRDSFLEFYEKHELTVPRNIFIENGHVQFYDYDGEVFLVPYHDDFDVIFNQASKYLHK